MLLEVQYQHCPLQGSRQYPQDHRQIELIRRTVRWKVRKHEQFHPQQSAVPTSSKKRWLQILKVVALKLLKFQLLLLLPFYLF